MKTFFRFSLVLAYGAFFAFLGAAVENHTQKLHAADPVALVIIGTQGALTVSKDGTIKSVASEDAARSIAKTLGVNHVAGVIVECTRDQSI